MSEKCYGLHCCLYRCVLYRYEKNSFRAVLCMASRTSNYFAVGAVTERDAFGSWWVFFYFGWFGVFLILDKQQNTEIYETGFLVLLCTAIEFVCST